MERGSTIGMDRFGLEHFLPTGEARGGARPALRRGLRRQDGALPRRQLLDRHALRGGQAPHAAALALQPHLRRHPARAPEGRRHRGPDRADAGAQPARDLRGAARKARRDGHHPGRGRAPLRGRRQLGQAAAGARSSTPTWPRSAWTAQDNVYAFNRGEHPMVVLRPRRQLPALVGRGRVPPRPRRAHGARRHDLAHRRRRPHRAPLHPRRQGAADHRGARQAGART